LHEGLYVVEGVVEDPIHGSTGSSGDNWHIDGSVVLGAAGRG
jgi:hypothetical protein